MYMQWREGGGKREKERVYTCTVHGTCRKGRREREGGRIHVQCRNGEVEEGRVG